MGIVTVDCWGFMLVVLNCVNIAVASSLAHLRALAGNHSSHVAHIGKSRETAVGNTQDYFRIVTNCKKSVFSQTGYR